MENFAENFMPQFQRSLVGGWWTFFVESLGPYWSWILILILLGGLLFLFLNSIFFYVTSHKYKDDTSY